MVSGAPAQVALMGFSDFFFRNGFPLMLLHKGRGGHDKARGAESALDSAFIHIGLLHF